MKKPRRGDRAQLQHVVVGHPGSATDFDARRTSYVQSRSRLRAVRGKDADAYRRFEQAVELPMLVAALLFIPLLVGEAVGWGSRVAIDTAYFMLSALFAVEYAVKLYLAPNRRRMVRTHVLDLVLIVVPFLRPLRAARLLRFLRLGAAAGRAAVGVRRITGRRGFRGFLLVVFTVTVLGGVLLWFVERGTNDAVRSPLDGVWWAIVTATTVGYGDIFPTTPEGRGIGVVMMLVGISLLSVVTANIAAFFVEGEDGSDELRERLDRIEAKLDQLVLRDPTDDETPV